MRDLQKYAKECMAELDKLNIEYGNIIRFEINTRAKKRWGQCKKTPNGYIININVDLLDERNDVNGLKNTIIHEILHTCEGCMNHGKKWQMYASKVYKAYGYNVKRVSSSEEKGCEYRRELNKKELIVKAYPKYEVRCKCCGKSYFRSKRTKVIVNPENYRCGFCGGELRRIC